MKWKRIQLFFALLVIPRNVCTFKCIWFDVTKYFRVTPSYTTIHSREATKLLPENLPLPQSERSKNSSEYELWNYIMSQPDYR